jgi:hypothetical protein
MIYGPLHQKILLREIPHGKLINILYSFSSKIFPRTEKIVKEVNSKRNRSVEGNLKQRYEDSKVKVLDIKMTNM